MFFILFAAIFGGCGVYYGAKIAEKKPQGYPGLLTIGCGFLGGCVLGIAVGGYIDSLFFHKLLSLAQK